MSSGKPSNSSCTREIHTESAPGANNTSQTHNLLRVVLQDRRELRALAQQRLHTRRFVLRAHKHRAVAARHATRASTGSAAASAAAVRGPSSAAAATEKVKRATSTSAAKRLLLLLLQLLALLLLGLFGALQFRVQRIELLRQPAVVFEQLRDLGALQTQILCASSAN